MIEHVDSEDPDVEEVEELKSRQPGEIDSICAAQVRLYQVAAGTGEQQGSRRNPNPPPLDHFARGENGFVSFLFVLGSTNTRAQQSCPPSPRMGLKVLKKKTHEIGKEKEN
jgi:hypothetical protein